MGSVMWFKGLWFKGFRLFSPGSAIGFLSFFSENFKIVPASLGAAAFLFPFCFISLVSFGLLFCFISFIIFWIIVWVIGFRESFE